MGSSALSGCGKKLSNMLIDRRPSPNFGPRFGVVGPSLIVIHYTAMPTSNAALERLCDPLHEVSAHYLINQQGGVIQLVAEAQRAWHAGAGSWGDCDDVNSASIGVELCNAGNHEFPALQIQTLKTLLGDIMQRWGISAEKVIGHSDMAPTRKQDPGRLFNWQALAIDGFAVFRGQSHVDILPFFHAARQFGYFTTEGACPEDTAQVAVLEAFRQRFRPQAQGPMDHNDVRILSDLAQSYPAIPEA